LPLTERTGISYRRIVKEMHNSDFKQGFFTGTLEITPSGDGVHWIVDTPFSYTDGEEHSLTANEGFSTDGASIPRALWTVIGSPFTGKYVQAAVIHDVGCVSHKYSWQITDRMFYSAMLDSGVSESQAKLLYWGVLVGGPRWETESNLEQGRTDSETRSHQLTEAQVRAFAAEILERQNAGDPITLPEIEARTPRYKN